jgi:DNA-binding CsgD family transcriptional regulator
VTPFLVAAEVAEARRDSRQLRELEKAFETHFAGDQGGPVEVLRAELRAIGEMLAGSPRAPESFGLVAERYARLGVPVRAAHRRATSAALRLRDRSTRAAARRELRQIRAELAKRGANRYVQNIDAVLSRRRQPVMADALLSRTELKVAQLVARGLTDERIGRELRMSRAQASASVAQIRARLGVASRAQIASWASQRAGASVAAG